MGTEAFAFTVSYLNGIYAVSQPTNGNLLFEIPQAKAKIQTHPTDPNIFYFNDITLDQTKITNITPVTRAATIAYIVGLAIASPLSVAITSTPSNALNATGTALNTVTGNAPVIALRVIAGSGQFAIFRQLTAVVNLGLGTWAQLTLTKNPTVAGGTWAAAFVGSILEKNNLTGFTATGGTAIWSGSVRSEQNWDLKLMDPTIVNGDVLVLSAVLFAVASVGVSINWNEKT